MSENTVQSENVENTESVENVENVETDSESIQNVETDTESAETPENRAKVALAKFTKPVQAMLEMSKVVLRDLITTSNALADEIKSAREDVDVTIQGFLEDENTEDQTIQEYQERKAELEATLEANENAVKEYVRENLLDVTPMSDEEYNAKRKELASSVKQIKDMKGVAEQFKEYDSDVWADLPPVKGAGTRGGSAAGAPKPRIKKAIVNGVEFVGKKNAKGRNVLSFGTLADYLNAEAKVTGDAKVKPSDLSEVALKEADGDLSIGADFNYSVNGTDFRIKVSA